MIYEVTPVAIAIPEELSPEIIEGTTIISEGVFPETIVPKPKKFGIVDIWHVRNQRRFGNL